MSELDKEVTETVETETAEEVLPETEESAAEVEAPEAEVAQEESEEKKPSKKKIRKLEEQIEQLEQEKADLSDRLVRKVAEFDNYRKRTDREKLESVSLGTTKTLEAMLPVFDSLQLAAATQCSDETYKKGVDLTVQLYRSTLEKLGVTEMDAIGKPFDPRYHNAVMTVPAEEGQESGIVTQVFQNGYMHNDKVIRCAMVVVSE